MGTLKRNWRILSASFFSVMLIAFAYFTVHSFGTPSKVEASTELALLQAIATKDSTGDGLPDWQKALYGIPINATTTDYFNLGMTDGEAVARGLIVPKAATTIASTSPTSDDTSITATFARYFFALYLSAKQANGGVELSADQVDTLASQALEQLTETASARVEQKTAADIFVLGTGHDALLTYAATAEKVISTVSPQSMGVASTSEIDLLKRLVEQNDPDAHDQLIGFSQMYRNYAENLRVVPVPVELATDHVNLINLFLLRSRVDSDLASVATDPLAAMVALERFLQTESTFWNIFTDIAAVYAAAHVTLEGGVPGSRFVNVTTLLRQSHL